MQRTMDVSTAWKAILAVHCSITEDQSFGAVIKSARNNPDLANATKAILAVHGIAVKFDGVMDEGSVIEVRCLAFAAGADLGTGTFLKGVSDGALSARNNAPLISPGEEFWPEEFIRNFSEYEPELDADPVQSNSSTVDRLREKITGGGYGY